METKEKKTVWQKIVSFFPILPAIAVLAIVVGALSGYKPNTYSVHAQAQQNQAAQAAVGAAANVADGKYTGSAQGFKSTITVEVTVKNHKITAIDGKSQNDTASFFNRAKNGVIPAIIEKQSTDVDVVSGATYSSNGIKNAVKNALGQSVTSSKRASGYSAAKKNATVQAPPAGSTYKDGTYTGSAQGFNGPVTVAVTIKDNKITAVEVKSNSDTPSFFNNAKNKVIPEIVKNNSTNVDAYTGATYSSNGIKNATANALNKAVVKADDSVKKAAASETKAASTAATAEAPATPVLKDGTYTVTSKVKPLSSNPQFQAYDITLKVTIKDGKIASVTDINGAKGANKMFSTRAANSIPSEVVKAQSTDVDVVSGATCSSKAILDGVSIALDQASK